MLDYVSSKAILMLLDPLAIKATEKVAEMFGLEFMTLENRLVQIEK